MYLACWVSNSAWALALASEPALLLRLLLHLDLEAAEKVQETRKEDCNYTGHNEGEMPRLRPCRGHCHLFGGSRVVSEEDQFSSKQIIQFVIERSRNRNSSSDSISLTQAFQCHIVRETKQFALYGTRVRERTLKRFQSRAGHKLKTAGVIFCQPKKIYLTPNGLPRCECTPPGCALALSSYPPSDRTNAAAVSCWVHTKHGTRRRNLADPNRQHQRRIPRISLHDRHLWTRAERVRCDIC